MSANPLVSIQIENLRGAVTPFKLTFEKGKKLTIIYGENGTGKSTVSDAFDFLGNGNVGSLDRRGLGVTQKFWPSIGKAQADVKVTLDTQSGQCSVVFGKKDIAVANEALRPKVAVLRRSEILGLIEAKPADRYAQIRRFVDVTGVEAAEGTLRKLAIDKDREYETAATRVSENLGEIERFWKQAEVPAQMRSTGLSRRCRRIRATSTRARQPSINSSQLGMRSRSTRTKCPGLRLRPRPLKVRSSRPIRNSARSRTRLRVTTWRFSTS